MKNEEWINTGVHCFQFHWFILPLSISRLIDGEVAENTIEHLRTFKFRKSRSCFNLSASFSKGSRRVWRSVKPFVMMSLHFLNNVARTKAALGTFCTRSPSRCSQKRSKFVMTMYSTFSATFGIS